MDREDGETIRTSRKNRSKRRAPKNTEWRGNTLHGRVRIAGKLHRWSLRTGDVETARARIAAEIEKLKAQARYGDVRARYADIVASWGERHIMHEVRPRTAQRYAVSLRQLEPWLLDCFLDEIDKGKIDEIVTARRAQGVSTATIRRDLTALSSVLEFADVEPNPALARQKRLTERRDPIVLPEAADVDKVIARAPGAIAVLVAVARATGCRLDELVTAERAKLDHSRRQLTVVGKANKLRVIDLDYGGAYELVRGLIPRIGCRWLFWHHDGEPYRNLSSRFAALVRSIAAMDSGFRKYRFHDLRHLHAVEWLKSGRSIYDLQQRLGHSSIKTTEIYLRYLTPEEKRAAMYGAREAVEGKG